MTAIRRGNALNRYRTDAPNLGKGGSGRAPGTLGKAPVGDKARFPADPAAELMPAAEFLGHEPDFPAILESFEGSPFDPARRRVLGRLMGVFAMDYQGARTEERRFLKRLLAARNAREGYAANRALHLCGTNHAIRRTLALGVAEARQSHGPIRGFLGAVQARIAATTFQMLGPHSRELLWSTLTLAGTGSDGAVLEGADPVIERALVLKALAARRHRVGPWCADGPAAVEEIVQFAREIRGALLDELAAKTSLEPIDAELQDPVAFDEAAVPERAWAEIDPVFAWTRNGRRAAVANGQATDLDPWEVLPELDRSPLLERPRVHQALAEARAKKGHPLVRHAHDALTRFITGFELDARGKQDLELAFRVIGEHGFDFAPRQAIDAIRADSMGIYRFDAARALSDMLSRFTGATYVRRVFSDQLTAGTDPMTQIALSLEAGMPVPMTLQQLRKDRFRALSVLESQTVEGRRKDYKLRVNEPGGELDAFVMGSMLLQPELPEAFGKRTRADAYLAPAALDLLAPPFGIPFARLGIEDDL